MLKSLAFKQFGDIRPNFSWFHSFGIKYCLTMYLVRRYFGQIVGLTFKIPSVNSFIMKPLFCLRESGTDNPVRRRRVPEEQGPQLFVYEHSRTRSFQKYGLHWYFRNGFMTVDSSFLSSPIFPLFMPCLTDTFSSLLICIGQEAMKPTCFSFVSGWWSILLEIEITNHW